MHRHLKTALASLALALLLPSAAHAASPGVNVIDDLNRVPAAIGTGAQEVRLFVDWAAFEPDSAGQIDTATPGPSVNLRDATFNAIKTIKGAGRRVMIVVTGAPKWANGGNPDTTPPDAQHVGDYATFVQRFVRRAADAGAPINGIEIWNEPDGGEFWKPAPDASGYTTLLKAAYAAIKDPAKGDPNVNVFTGPTAGNDYDWIQKLYDNGAKGNFDGVSVHTDTACLTASPDSFYRDPNGRLGRYTFLGYREVRATMLANGDDKQIAMSELGWSSTGGAANSCTRGDFAGKKPDGVDAPTQARYLSAAFGCLANDPYVTIADWFQLDDTANNPLNEFNHYGLYGAGPDFGAKPSLGAFQGIVPGGGAPAPCGDFTPPAINVLSPTPGQQFDDRIDIKASATDGGVGLGRITFSADDSPTEIRNFTGADLATQPVALTPWFGSRDLAVGPHTIKVTAVDNNGNTATVSVPVQKVAAGSLAATLTPFFKVSKKPVSCRNRTVRIKKRKVKALVCSLKGSLLRGQAGTPSIGGKVAAEWQFRNKKGQYRKLIGGLKPANKPFTLTAKLTKPGKWRVRAVYQAKAPWKATQSAYVYFTVKRTRSHGFSFRATKAPAAPKKKR